MFPFEFNKLIAAKIYLWFFLNTVIYLGITSAASHRLSLEQDVRVVVGILAVNLAIWSVYTITKFYSPKTYRGY